MSEKILKELSKGFINRMKDWAVGTLMPDCSLVPSSWPSDGGKGEGSGHNPMRTPRLLGWVHETQAAIDELEPRHKYAVCQFWWRPDASLSQLGREREVSDVTFCTWIMEGHEKLKAAFAIQMGNVDRRQEEGEKRYYELLAEKLSRGAQYIA